MIDIVQLFINADFKIKESHPFHFGDTSLLPAIKSYKTILCNNEVMIMLVLNDLRELCMCKSEPAFKIEFRYAFSDIIRCHLQRKAIPLLQFPVK